MQRAVTPQSPDAYVASFGGWRGRSVAALRSAVLEAAPVREVVTWGHLVYLSHGPVVLIRPGHACSARLLAWSAPPDDRTSSQGWPQVRDGNIGAFGVHAIEALNRSPVGLVQCFQIKPQ